MRIRAPRATRVIFRTWKDTGDVIAFFPETYGDPDTCNPGMVQSYMHVGQHGEADYQALQSQTRLATLEERADLHRELEGIYGPVLAVERLVRRRR